MNEMTSYIKTENEDTETVVSDPNLSINSIGRSTSKSTVQNVKIYPNANNLPLLKTEYISDSISSEFECKNEPMRIDFEGDNK